MLILMAGSFGCGERSNACGVKVWCLGRRSRPDHVRSIPLPESSRAALLSHRGRQEQERLAAGDSWQESGLVFTTSVGTVVEPRNLYRIFEHLVQRAGVRRIRFHDLWHTCASLLLAQGVSPRVVMDMLGHSQLSITMDSYS
jgi:integrase